MLRRPAGTQSLSSKLTKLLKLLAVQRYAWAALRHRVAATTEHLEVIRFCAPATVVDVGANKGQFSIATRGLLPNARIEAFEPLPGAAERFEAVFSGDPFTRLHRVAVGSADERRPFHVADREDSSSLLKVGQGQRQAYGIGAAREIEVQVKPLDCVLDTSALPRPTLLKIDVQGAEMDVLRGIDGLGMFDFIYAELSFVELYEGQSLFGDVVAYLDQRGFTVRGIYNQSVTRAYGPTQVDCLFAKRGG